MVEYLRVVGHVGFFRLRWHVTCHYSETNAMDRVASTEMHQFADAAGAFA